MLFRSRSGVYLMTLDMTAPGGGAIEGRLSINGGAYLSRSTAPSTDQTLNISKTTYLAGGTVLQAELFNGAGTATIAADSSTAPFRWSVARLR